MSEIENYLNDIDEKISNDRKIDIIIELKKSIKKTRKIVGMNKIFWITSNTLNTYKLATKINGTFKCVEVKILAEKADKQLMKYPDYEEIVEDGKKYYVTKWRCRNDAYIKTQIGTLISSIRNNFNFYQDNILDVVNLQQIICMRYFGAMSIYNSGILYHHIGSGKTLTAILIMLDHLMVTQTHENVTFKPILMTPASLHTNFVGEIDTWAKKIKSSPNVDLSKIDRQVIHYNAGNFVSVIKRMAGRKFEDLDDDIWIETMLTYNKNLDQISKNPLYNKLYIIDEIHNVVSYMIGTSKRQKFIYKFFGALQNCKVIGLSGTPIKKHPYELAVLYNLITGKINSTNFLFPEDKTDFETLMEQKNSDDIILRYLTGFVSYYPMSNENMPSVKTQKIDVVMSNIQSIDFDIQKEKEEDYIGKSRFGNIGLRARQQMRYIKKDVVSASSFNIYTRQLSNFCFPYGFDEIYPIARPRKIDYLDIRESLKTIADYDFRDISDSLKSLLRIFFDNDNDFENFILWTNVGEQNKINKLTLEATQTHLKRLHNLISIAKPKKEKNRNGLLELQKYINDNRKYVDDEFTVIFNKRKKRIFDKILHATSYDDLLTFICNMLQISKHSFNTRNNAYLEANPFKNNYADAIKQAIDAIDKLKTHYLVKKDNETGLMKYSPKMGVMLDKLESEAGKAFIYSSYVEVEGVKMISKMLEANGYVRFDSRMYDDYINVFNEEESDIPVPVYNVDGIDKNKEYLPCDFENVVDVKIETFLAGQLKLEYDPDIIDVHPDYHNRYTNNNDIPKIKDIKGCYALYIGPMSAEAREKTRIVFNHPKNCYGNYLRIIVGSSAAAEGITFKCVNSVHLFEPQWTKSIEEQIFGRTIRTASHNDLEPNRRYVNIYRYNAVSQTGKSIDREFETRTSTKHELIDHYLNIMKRASIDANLYDGVYIDVYTPGNNVNEMYSSSERIETLDKNVSSLGKIHICYVKLQPIPVGINVNNLYIRVYNDSRLDDKIVYTLVEHEGTKYKSIVLLTKFENDTKYHNYGVILTDNNKYLEYGDVKLLQNIYEPPITVIRKN